MILELLTLGVAGFLGWSVRRMEHRLDELQRENGIEHSATRLYLGRLGGDPGLIDTAGKQTINSGTF